MFFLGMLSIQCKIGDRTVDRDQHVGHPWYIALNVGQQAYCVDRL